MDAIRDALIWLDPWLIWAYRLSGHAFSGFLLGTFVLCLGCAVLGDAGYLLARRLNRRVYGEYHDEMIRRHNLSVRAIGQGNKAAYKAANKLAHEAFGKYFFSQAGVFTASLWPAPFALAWMDLRFRHVPLSLPVSLPGIGKEVAYPFFFIPLYIAARMLYGRLARCVPAYRRLQDWAAHGRETDVLRFEDLGRPPAPAVGASPDSREEDQGNGTHDSGKEIPRQ